jgi:biotin synthase-related radical SAM superfamily protein
MSCEVHVVMGDDDGGAHGHITLGLSEEFTVDAIPDELIAKVRTQSRNVFLQSFGQAPKQTVVYVEETP